MDDENKTWNPNCIDSKATVPLAYHEMCETRNFRRTMWIVIGWVVTLLFSIGISAYERLQYDYVSTEETSGVYVVSDSEGNVIAADLTPEDVIRIMEVLRNGNNSENQDKD